MKTFYVCKYFIGPNEKLIQKKFNNYDKALKYARNLLTEIKLTKYFKKINLNVGMFQHKLDVV